MIIFKVVKRMRDGQRCSATSMGRRLSYEQNKMTVPPPGCGPLAAFKDFGHARSFAHALSDTSHSMEVWEAEGMPSDEDKVYCVEFFGMALDILPKNTVLMKEITLVRLIGDAGGH